MVFSEPLTWKCHICGEERPDAKISVLTKPLVINGMACGNQNIRFCNDKAECLEGAQHKDFFGEEGGDEHPLVDPALCEKCGFKGTPLCTHPNGYYQDEPAGLNKLLDSGNDLVNAYNLRYTQKEMPTVQSGIYARFGAERKDVITEATAQEFKDWLAIKGLNISFMSDDTLNGLFMEREVTFWRWAIRMAFIRDAEARGITVYKEKDEWEAFVVAYQEEAHRRWG